MHDPFDITSRALGRTRLLNILQSRLAAAAAVNTSTDCSEKNTAAAAAANSLDLAKQNRLSAIESRLTQWVEWVCVEGGERRRRRKKARKTLFCAAEAVLSSPTLSLSRTVFSHSAW